MTVKKKVTKESEYEATIVLYYTAVSRDAAEEIAQSAIDNGIAMTGALYSIKTIRRRQERKGSV